MTECNCYVAELDEETRFSLHYGAHSPECPAYSESLDPVDWLNDTTFRLQHAAKDASQYRGHRMGSFDQNNQAACIECQAWVQVDPNPAPNGIDIGGPAVAIRCEEYRQYGSY